MDTLQLMFPATPDLLRLPAVLCALREEFAPLDEFVQERRTVAGVKLMEVDLGGRRVLGVISGVGKVWAARASTVLAAEGATCLLVAGVCGGLTPELSPGSLVHGTSAAQWDSWNKRGRESEAERGLLEAWQRVLPGVAARILTGDRAVFHPLRARQLRRIFQGPAACDMETAAAGAVAVEAGVPWAVLRAVTDRPRWFRRGSDFQGNFPAQAGRAAASVPALLEALHQASP